jgi:hypothetical protein
MYGLVPEKLPRLGVSAALLTLYAGLLCVAGREQSQTFYEADKIAV